MTAPQQQQQQDAGSQAEQWELAVLAAIAAAVLLLCRRNSLTGLYGPEQRLRRDLRAITAARLQAATAAARAAITESAATGRGSALRELAGQRVALPLRSGLSDGVALVNEAVAAIRAAAAQTEASAMEVYRRVATVVAAQAAESEAARIAVAEKACADATTNGVPGMVDKTGRPWSLTAYLQMLVRTLAHKAQVTAHTATLAMAGQDLVIVGYSSTPCAACKPWEGAVLSISGLTTTEPVAGSVGDAKAAGLWHPNCRHTITLWTGPDTVLPRPAVPDSGYTRMLDLIGRRLRQARRRRVVALTPGARAEADRLIHGLRTQQARLQSAAVRNRTGRDSGPRDDLAAKTAPETSPKPVAAGGGSGPPKPPDTRPPVAAAGDDEPKIPDLSALPDIGDLLDVPVDDADDDDLLKALRPLETRYGPFRLKLAYADYIYGASTVMGSNGLPRRGPRSVIGFSFTGHIVDDELGSVGSLVREINYGKEHEIVVHNELLKLEPAAQGRGFAPVLYAALENWYRRSGVDRIQIHAALTHGGYAWARAGFDFDPEELDDSIFMIRRHADKIMGDLSAADQQIVRSTLARFDGPVVDYPTPSELANLKGVDTPALGKKLMKGSEWFGVKRLRP